MRNKGDAKAILTLSVHNLFSVAKCHVVGFDHNLENKFVIWGSIFEFEQVVH